MRAETDNVNCPSCGATLIAGLRFCRMCGYRLGEGVEEYVATQRFDASQMPTAAQPQPPATDPFAPRQTWGAAPMQPARPFGAPLAPEQPQAVGWVKACAPKRAGWWMWVVIALVLMVAAGMVPLTMRRNRGGAAGPGGGPTIVRSFVGVDGFEAAPGGGALVTGIAAPDTPFVRAGLIGGDIIKTFDGKPVKDDDAMMEILRETPAGKTVPVEYVRDGVLATTTVTTIATRDNPGLRPFDRRPGGAGNIGLDRGDLDRVQVPGTNIYGAELGDVDRNGPADLAGLRRGDIVIKFGDYLIRTPGDLRYRISEALPGGTVPVLVVRGSEQVTVPVKIGRSKD
jgi:serine protease Do